LKVRKRSGSLGWGEKRGRLARKLWRRRLPFGEGESILSFLAWGSVLGKKGGNLGGGGKGRELYRDSANSSVSNDLLQEQGNAQGREKFIRSTNGGGEGEKLDIYMGRTGDIAYARIKSI